MAYPGGFLVARKPAPCHDFFNQGGVTPLLAPTFTSHLHLRLLETPLETNSGYATAFPFENSYIFIYGSATRGLSDFPKKCYVTLEVECPVTRSIWNIIGVGDGYDMKILDIQIKTWSLECRNLKDKDKNGLLPSSDYMNLHVGYMEFAFFLRKKTKNKKHSNKKISIIIKNKIKITIPKTNNNTKTSTDLSRGVVAFCCPPLPSLSSISRGPCSVPCSAQQGVSLQPFSVPSPSTSTGTCQACPEKQQCTDETLLENVLFIEVAMHWFATASRPKLSQTDPKWFVFEISWYAFGGRIHRSAK